MFSASIFHPKKSFSKSLVKNSEKINVTVNKVGYLTLVFLLSNVAKVLPLSDKWK